jgi:GTP-binding protein
MQEKRNESDFKVLREELNGEEYFRVLGVKPERWVAQTNFGNEEAIGYLGDRLQKIGVEDALLKAGAVAGSTVIIGPGAGIVFDWEPTIGSTAELLVAPRGIDPRLEMRDRRTTKERREEYKALMDGKEEARQELQAERRAGLWSGDDQFETDEVEVIENYDTIVVEDDNLDGFETLRK